MKKIYKLLTVIILATLCNTQTKAQGCIMASNYPSGTVAINGTPGSTVIITNCNFASEYSVNNFTATGIYSVTSSVATDYITVTDNANAYLTSGNTPLAVSIPSTGIYRIHIATSSTCGTQSSCRTTSVIRPQAPCAGPLASSTVVASVYTLCPGAPVTFSVNNAYNSTGISYQWQAGASPTGPFAAIPGATLSTFATTGTTTTAYINAVITCSNGPATTTASVAQITPGIPNVTASISSTLLCGSSSAVLSLAPPVSAVNYQWQQSATGSAGSYSSISSGTTSPYTATSTLATTWYNAVVSCSANSSFSLATNTVQVVYSPNPTITINSSSTNFCYPNGAALSFTASGASSYTWNPAAYLTPSTSAVATATNLPGPITISVTGKNAVGCSATSSVITISYNPAVSISSLTSSSSTLCSGGNATFAVVAANATIASYCQPAYSTGTSAGDYIGGVTLGNITNTTAALAAPYYTMYPSSITTTLTAGTAYTLTLQPGSYTSNNGLASWIDYNQNGNFYDSNEKIAQLTINAAYPATGLATFTVPLAAKNGTTILRVREVFANTNIDPCASATYGDTQDYMVTIVGGVTPANTYSWSPSAFLTSTNTASTIANSVTATTVYSVNVNNSFGCAAQGTIALNLNTPTITAASSASSFICVGQTATLTAGGGINYVWNTTATTAVIAVSPTTTTSYTVTGTNSASCSASAIITQSVSTCTGLNIQSGSALGINLYPNPNNGEFTIELKNGTIGTIEVSDLTGRIVRTLRAGSDMANVSLNGLANGLYYVKVSGDSSSEIIKVVKQ